MHSVFPLFVYVDNHKCVANTIIAELNHLANLVKLGYFNSSNRWNNSLPFHSVNMTWMQHKLPKIRALHSHSNNVS